MFSQTNRATIQALFLDAVSEVFGTLLHASTMSQDDPRHSRLLADFSSVGGNVILMQALFWMKSQGAVGWGQKPLVPNLSFDPKIIEFLGINP